MDETDGQIQPPSLPAGPARERGPVTRGNPASRRERARHDQQQRNVAALIQRDYPSWLILYGPWSRKFWAYSTHPAPPGHGLVLSSRDPNDLAAQIRQADQAAVARARN